MTDNELTADEIKRREKEAHARRNAAKPKIIVPNSPLNASKNNATGLGLAFEALIAQYPFEACAPGQVDFLAIVGALNTLLAKTFMQMPKHHRVPMIDTTFKTIMPLKDKPENIRVVGVDRSNPQ